MNKLLKPYRLLFYRIYIFYAKSELANHPLEMAFYTIFFIQILNLLYVSTSDLSKSVFGWLFIGLVTMMGMNFFVFDYKNPLIVEEMENEFENVPKIITRLMDVFVIFYIIGSFLILVLRSGRI